MKNNKLYPVRKYISTPLTILLCGFSISAFAQAQNNQCQVTMLPSGSVNKTLHVNSNNEMTFRYHVVCPTNKKNDILISKNKYAGKFDTMYAGNRNQFKLKLISNPRSALINQNGYFIISHSKNSTISNSFSVGSNPWTSYPGLPTPPKYNDGNKLSGPVKIFHEPGYKIKGFIPYTLQFPVVTLVY